MGEAGTEDTTCSPSWRTELDDFSERYQTRLPLGAMKTLLALAYTGPQTQSSLVKIVGMRYASVHTRIKNLCKLGLTVKTGEAMSKKGVTTIFTG